MSLGKDIGDSINAILDKCEPKAITKADVIFTFRQFAKNLAESSSKDAQQVKHDDDCHLGDNYKDCAACRETQE